MINIFDLTFARHFEQLQRGRIVPDDRKVDSDAESLHQELSTLLELVAVSGSFTPRALPNAAQNRARVLGALSQLCHIEAAENESTWTLEWGPRIDTLQRLKTSGRLPSLLESALPETDAFGVALRDVLAGRSEQESANREQLLAYSKAYEVGEELGIMRRPPSLTYDIEVANDTWARSIVTHHFIGRKRFLKTIAQFVRDDNPPTLVLTGLGGAGKSALLARVAEEAVRDSKATADRPQIIPCMIDFDLPGVDPSDHALLDSLVAKQVGLRLGADAFDLVEKGRRELYRNRVLSSDAGGLQSSHSSSRQRSERSVLMAVTEAIEHFARPSPVLLLMLDTAEEVPALALSRLGQWFGGLHSRIGSSAKLRTVVSGRLFDAAAQKWAGVFDAARTITLDALDEGEARDLLVVHGLSERDAKRLLRVELLPRRPLELTLLAHVVRYQGISAIEDLQKDLRAGGKVADRLFAGLVYKRILLRVSEDIRAIAHPGLVLQYITPQILIDVLYPALNLGRLALSDARSLLDKLASYTWLAYREGDKVWHRKDLRESVLLAMLGQSKEHENIARIHQYAIKYFERNEQSEDAVYHRLMLWGSDQNAIDPPSLEQIRRHAGTLGQRMAELPKSAAVLLQHVTRSRVEAEDISLLPAAFRPEAYDRAGRDLLAYREFGQARRLIDSLDRADFGGSHAAWELETLFATGEWDRMRPPSLRMHQTFRELMSVARPAALAAGGARVRADLFSSIADNLHVSDTRSNVAIDAESLAVTLASLLVSRPLDTHEAYVVNSINEQMAKIASDSPSPELENRLLLTRLFVDPAYRNSAIGLATPHMMSIHPRWLRRLRYLAVSDDSQDVLNMLCEKLERSVMEGGTVEEVLAAVDGVGATGTYSRGIRVQLGMLDASEFVDGFIGPSPHLRDLCRYALISAFSQKNDWGVFVMALNRITFRDIREFQHSELLRELERDPEHALIKPLEFIDRCGQLYGFMRVARDSLRKYSYPHNHLGSRLPDHLQPLAKSIKALERWRSSLRRHWEPWNSPAYKHKRSN